MIINKLTNIRAHMAVLYFKKRLKNKNITIISDNCWGGNFYKQLRLEPNSPTVGLGMDNRYLNFIENLRSEDILDFTELDSSHCHELRPPRTYPMGKNPFTKIHFLHYNSFETAVRFFKIRYNKINWDNIFYKIDFEYSHFRPADIEKWNTMKLPNSIAFYSERVKNMWEGKIHNGVYVENWNEEHCYIFANFQNYFDYIHWLNTGEVKTSKTYKVVNFILLNPNSFKNIKKYLKKSNATNLPLPQNT